MKLLETGADAGFVSFVVCPLVQSLFDLLPGLESPLRTVTRPNTTDIIYNVVLTCFGSTVKTTKQLRECGCLCSKPGGDFSSPHGRR